MSAARRWRNGPVFGVLAIAALSAGGATVSARHVQSRNDLRQQERLDEAHRREAEVLVRMADDARAGRVVADFAIEWHNDFLKAQPGTFVPFTVSVDRSALDSAHALMYVRAVRVPETAGASEKSAPAPVRPRRTSYARSTTSPPPSRWTPTRSRSSRSRRSPGATAAAGARSRGWPTRRRWSTASGSRSALPGGPTSTTPGAASHPRAARSRRSSRAESARPGTHNDPPPPKRQRAVE